MRICLSGDSWACGEWGYDSSRNYTILHNGLEYFLSQTHQVLNIGQSATSINDSVEKLKLALKSNDFDYIFWFQTDPLRNTPANFFSESISFDDIMNEQHKQLIQSYEDLNNLNVPIHCIGGCSKLDLKRIKPFSNLVPYIESVTEWLEPEYIHPAIWASRWIFWIDNIDSDSLDKLLVYKKMQDRLIEYKNYFWPDGGHLNRIGHEMLFNKICKDFNL